MAKTYTILLIIVFGTCVSFAQSKKEVDSLLTEICRTENSKRIISNSSAIKLISYGEKVLNYLVPSFQDTSHTNTRSDCQDVFLKRGEIAIIIADHIEIMPYALLTGVQNCLLVFCKDNPNLIEYYLYWIREDVQVFAQKYADWLKSSGRKKWTPYKNNNKRNVLTHNQ